MLDVCVSLSHTAYLGIFFIFSLSLSLEICERFALNIYEPVYGDFGPGMEVKSLQSFHSSFFSLSLSLAQTLSLSLFLFLSISFSLSLSFPCYCLSMDISVLVFLLHLVILFVHIDFWVDLYSCAYELKHCTSKM